MLREMVGRQHRSFTLDEVEIRADDATGGFTFEGVASTVDEPYTVRDMFGEFTEVIESGAFDKTLREATKRVAKGRQHDIALFVNHDYKRAPLATVSSGRLELWADPNLRVRAALNPDRHDVHDFRHAVNDGEMRQMSIGFDIPQGKNEWTETADGGELHTIREVKLYEASAVWMGANHLTSAGMRSADLIALLDDMHPDPDELRRVLDELRSRITADEADPEPKPAVVGPSRELLLALWDKKL